MYKRRWVKAFAAACNVLLWNKRQQQMREVFLGLQKDPRSQLASYSHGRDDPVVPWVSSLAVKTCGTSGRSFQHVILVHLIHISRKNRGSSRGVSCFLFMRFDVLWYKAGWYRNDTKDVFHPKLKLATVFWLRGWIFVWKLTFSDQDSSHRHEPFLLCVGVGREKTGGGPKTVPEDRLDGNSPHMRIIPVSILQGHILDLGVPLAFTSTLSIFYVYIYHKYFLFLEVPEMATERKWSHWVASPT